MPFVKSPPPFHRTATRCARAAVQGLGQPGGTPWLVALLLTTAAWWLPVESDHRVAKAALMVTAILMLATGRSWRPRRTLTDLLMLGSSVCAVGALMSRAPFAWQIGFSPVAMTVAILISLAADEWRFAPDWGQQGVHWALIAGVTGTLWSGLGMGVAMVIIGAAARNEVTFAPAVYAAGALVGWAFGRSLQRRSPFRSRSNTLQQRTNS
jgi:hypothetical protein